MSLSQAQNSFGIYAYSSGYSTITKNTHTL
ncbi:hypothetical protein [Aetokthonos hydrillicola]|nr:hypothetical protein [Aetokthonos hydrillicola CCALA 1050]MBW4587680.1 hypothetical protein [Aetokthonos hydrillicola CCALA 1050]